MDSPLAFKIMAHFKILDISCFDALLSRLSTSDINEFQNILSMINQLLKGTKVSDSLRSTFLYQLDQLLFQVLSSYQGDEAVIDQVIQRITHYQIRLQAYILTEQFEKAIVLCIEHKNLHTLASMKKMVAQKKIEIQSSIQSQMTTLLEGG